MSITRKIVLSFKNYILLYSYHGHTYLSIPISTYFCSNNINDIHTLKVIKTALEVWVMKKRSGNRTVEEKNYQLIISHISCKYTCKK